MQWEEENFTSQCFLPGNFCVHSVKPQQSFTNREEPFAALTGLLAPSASVLITEDCSLGPGHGRFTPYLKIFLSVHLLETGK